MRRSLAPLLLLSIVTGCSSSAPKAPQEAAGATADGPCDPELRAFLEKEMDLEAETRARLALNGIGESCRGLPGGITETLAAINQADPADAATVMVAGLEEEGSFARLGCPGFKAMKSAVAAAPVSDKARTLYKSCELARLDLATEAEVDTAWKSPVFATGVLAAPSLYVWLLENRMTQAEARKLTRQLLGLR